MDEMSLGASLIDYISTVIIPCIGICGVLGNLLNVGILSWRYWRQDEDTMEKVALVGLIALAISDLCFCLVLITNFGHWTDTAVFTEFTFGIYIAMYGTYFHDIFLKTSTWLTMIVATARYIAICHPLRARGCFGMTPTRWAVAGTYAFWILFLSPLLFNMKLNTHDMNGTMLYILDIGALQESEQMKYTFSYFWAFTGYFIPVAILAFCNICLISALRESRLLREHATRQSRAGYNRSNRNNNRITLTLVALVFMFLVLISPSEILQFCVDAGLTVDTLPSVTVAITCTNVLLAMNFAFHFLLYCAVNVTFRRTFLSLGYALLGWLRCRKRTDIVGGQESGSARSSSLLQSGRSHETNI